MNVVVMPHPCFNGILHHAKWNVKKMWWNVARNKPLQKGLVDPFTRIIAHSFVHHFQLPLHVIGGGDVRPFSLSFSCTVQSDLILPLLIRHRDFVEKPLDLRVPECDVLEAVGVGRLSYFDPFFA